MDGLNSGNHGRLHEVDEVGKWRGGRLDGWKGERVKKMGC